MNMTTRRSGLTVAAMLAFVLSSGRESSASLVVTSRENDVLARDYGYQDGPYNSATSGTLSAIAGVASASVTMQSTSSSFDWSYAEAINGYNALPGGDSLGQVGAFLYFNVTSNSSYQLTSSFSGLGTSDFPGYPGQSSVEVTD